MISMIEIGRDSHFMPKAGDVPDKSHRQVRFFALALAHLCRRQEGLKSENFVFALSLPSPFTIFAGKFNNMYYVRKRLEISASHQLRLSYESKCENLHGHNWIITVYCRAHELNSDGMVIDFSVIKHLVKERLDHKNLNDILPFNPTAENIARWICEQVPGCYKVEVQESENNIACYEAD